MDIKDKAKAKQQTASHEKRRRPKNFLSPYLATEPAKLESIFKAGSPDTAALYLIEKVFYFCGLKIVE